MSRRFPIRAAAYSVGFYVLLLMLRGLTFIVSHLPPGYIHMDWAVIGLSYLEQGMLLPRWLLRHLWFNESTPAMVNWLLGVLNSVAWGSAYAAFRIWRDPDRGNPPPTSVIRA